MPGFLRSPPRSPERALRTFARLEDDGSCAQDHPSLEEDPPIEDLGSVGSDQWTESTPEGTPPSATEGVPKGVSSRSPPSPACVAAEIDEDSRWDAAMERYRKEIEDGPTNQVLDKSKNVGAYVVGEDLAHPMLKENKPAYPTLAPSREETHQDPPTESDHGFELFNLYVEMAKSAFLKEPCEERWLDLVHSFQMQTWQEMQQQDVIDEEDWMPEGGESGNASWANFEGEAISQPTKSAQTPIAILEVQRKPRVKNSITSVEERAIHMIHADDGFDSPFDVVNDDNSFDEGCWVERDVSPMSLQRKITSNPANDQGSLSSEDEATNNSSAKEDASVETNSCVNDGKEHAPKPETIAKRAFAVPAVGSQGKASAYVLNEVRQWEQRIEQYDQRHVAVVAAALDETRNVVWKEGHILEVVPSALLGKGLPPAECKDGDEEILYVV